MEKHNFRKEKVVEKYYIHGFCEKLDYQGTTLYTHGEVNFQDLYKKLEDGLANHLYHLDSVRANRLFYIGNCDLQGANNKEVTELFDNEYSVLQLRRDKNGFFTKIPELIVEGGKQSGSQNRR